MTDARTKEAIRYLGYGRHAVDDHTLKLVESCFEELSQAACGRIVYRIFELEFPESGRILLGNLDIHSKNLYKNLTGCKKAVLLPQPPAKRSVPERPGWAAPGKSNQRGTGCPSAGPPPRHGPGRTTGSKSRYSPRQNGGP